MNEIEFQEIDKYKEFPRTDKNPIKKTQKTEKNKSQNKRILKIGTSLNRLSNQKIGLERMHQNNDKKIAYRKIDKDKDS